MSVYNIKEEGFADLYDNVLNLKKKFWLCSVSLCNYYDLNTNAGIAC